MHSTLVWYSFIIFILYELFLCYLFIFEYSPLKTVNTRNEFLELWSNKMDANKFSMFMTRIFWASIFIHFILHFIKEKIARGHKMTRNINDCVLFSFWACWWWKKRTLLTHQHSLSLSFSLTVSRSVCIWYMNSAITINHDTSSCFLVDTLKILNFF